MEPVRLGIIGCGVISGSHLKLAGAIPDAEMTAAADVVEDRARALCETFKIPKRYTSADGLLDDKDIDAVVLALPTGPRTPIALKALERGKHVLLEKPVAMNAADVEKMMRLRGKKVVACCSSRYTFTGHAEAAAKCVASGALGRIRVARFRAVNPAGAKPSDNPPPWRESFKLNGGGILVNWSCYDLNYIMHIADWQLRPKFALAKWWPTAAKMTKYAAPGSDADAHYIALILCEGDCVLSMERAEFSSASANNSWEIIGTDGTLHMPLLPPQGKPNAVILDRFVPGKGVKSETVWEAEKDEPRDNVLSDFVRAIREGCRPRTDLELALVMQKITDAIYASSQSGAGIAIL